MRPLYTKIAALSLLLSLASCSTLHPNPAQRAELKPMDGRWSVTAFHEDSELDEIELDKPGLVQETREDVERRRTGARVSYGIEYVQGYLELYGGEELGENIDGIGLGAAAEVELHEFGNGVQLFVPYRLGVSFSGGDQEFGGQEAEFATVEAVGELGIGLDYRGFRPSIGVTSKSLSGEIDFDDGSDDLDEIDADYSAAYLELAYRSPDLPLQLGIRGLAGDEVGVYFNLGFLF